MPMPGNSSSRPIHPLVGQAFAELLSRSTGIVVFEATLLVETGGYHAYDALITVEAPPEVRLERAVERGLERQAAQARLDAQATREERVAVADFVIENTGTLDELPRGRGASRAAARGASPRWLS